MRWTGLAAVLVPMLIAEGCAHLGAGDPGTEVAVVSARGLAVINPDSGSVRQAVWPQKVAPMALLPTNVGLEIVGQIQQASNSLAIPMSVAMLWQGGGAVLPWAIEFRSPNPGTANTGMEIQGGASAGNGIALYGFHGGGVGEIFRFFTPQFSQSTAMNALWNNPWEMQMNSSCYPPVLASAPGGGWLLQGGAGGACGYGLLGPGGQIAPVPSLAHWSHRTLAAAYTPGGKELALVTTGGTLWLAANGGAPQPVGTARSTAQSISSSGLGTGYTGHGLPPQIAWSGNGKQLAVGYGTALRIYALDGTTLQRQQVVELPTQIDGLAWAKTPVLPTKAALAAALDATETSMRDAGFAIPAPAGSPPVVKVSVRSSNGSVESAPVSTFVSAGCLTTNWCLIPRGRHSMDFAAVPEASVLQGEWLLLPPAGWLGPGTYLLSAEWSGGQAPQSFTLGTVEGGSTA